MDITLADVKSVLANFELNVRSYLPNTNGIVEFRRNMFEFLIRKPLDIMENKTSHQDFIVQIQFDINNEPIKFRSCKVDSGSEPVFDGVHFVFHSWQNIV